MVKSFLSSFWETRWVLLVVLPVFVCFKIPHLYYPFYCDESWVYVRAVKTMVINGPSLMPGSIPAACSRGHPLLFPFLFSLWIKCFGSSNVAVHIFPLLLSVLFLISIYEGCLRLFGSRVATLALLLVSTNVLFFVQSAFVLPEVMVAFFTFLSLYFYARDRLLLTSITLFMLFFTKEGGLVFGAVIGVDAFVSLFRSKESIRRRMIRLAAVIAPTLLIGLFFVLQKARLGWYLLPLHSYLIHTDWNSFYFMFREGLYWTLRGDIANYILVFFIILLSLVPAIRFKNVRYLFLILPAVIVYVLTNKYITDNTGDAIWMILFVLFFAIAVYYLLKLNKTWSSSARRFIILLSICFGAFLCYSSFSVVAYRYLLVNIILVLVFLAVCINTYIAAGGNNLYYAAIAGIMLIGVYAFYSDEGNTDADLEAFHAMKVQEKEISFLENENAYDKEILIGCYYAIGHFTDTMEGFLSSNRAFTNVKHEPPGPHTGYAIFDNVCGSENYDLVRKNPDYHLVYKTQDGKSWAEIYKRNEAY